MYDILDTAENDHYINDCHTDNYKSTASEKCAINDVEDDMKMENLRDFDNNLSEDEIPLLFLPKNNDQMPKKKSKMVRNFVTFIQINKMSVCCVLTLISPSVVGTACLYS